MDIGGTVRERAARELRDRILTGALPAGTRIDLDAITAEFATSRTPVREALLELSFEGLVRVAPRSGITVIGISSADVLDSFTILGVLTGQAAAWAAERVTDEELDQLRALAAGAPNTPATTPSAKRIGVSTKPFTAPPIPQGCSLRSSRRHAWSPPTSWSCSPSTRNTRCPSTKSSSTHWRNVTPTTRGSSPSTTSWKPADPWPTGWTAETTIGQGRCRQPGRGTLQPQLVCPLQALDERPYRPSSSVCCHRCGTRGNPVKIRDCPAAVCRNDRRHQHWPRLGAGKRRPVGVRQRTRL